MTESYSVKNIKHQRNIVLIMVIAPIFVMMLVFMILYLSNRQNPAGAQVSYAPPLWSANIENGNYAFGAGVSSSGNVSVVNEGYGGGKAVKIVHPPNQYYGAAWYPRLSGNLGITPLEDVYFRYYLKPDPNYHFRLEAKIPGLAGNTGDNYFPSGCDPVDPNKGWSGRLQWGLGPTYNNQKGRIQTYLYVGHPASNTGGCGFKANWDEGAELERGKWACIEIRYKMNTPGQNNGTMQGWFNGIKRYERNDIRFRNNTNIKATMMVNQFYHGGTAAWQPIQTQYYLYDNLAVSNQRIGCEGSNSALPSPSPLPAPAPINYTFSIDGTTMRWNQVPNSTKYKVYLADTQTYVILPSSTTSYAVPPPANGSSREVNWSWYDGQDHWGQTKTVNFAVATTPDPVVSPPPTPTPSLPTNPRPPITIPGANTENPVAIPEALPQEEDGSIIADFNGDGLNEVVRDLNADGYIDPGTEIVIDGSSNTSLTDSSSRPISPEEYVGLFDENILPPSSVVRIQVGSLPVVLIPKPVAYTFLIGGGITLTGVGIYAAVMNMAVFGAIRTRIGL